VILMPIVYVTDMDRSIEFYASLGFELRSRGDHRSELVAGEGAVLALHLAPATRLELALVAPQPLEHVLETHADALARPIADEGFGRSLVLQDPDGLRLQVNEHDPELTSPS
jgi:catechol 2,3-dioxygenase-like lactoylglutathione lyase family enzyme